MVPKKWMPKILDRSTRQWRCPGCSQVYEVPNRKDDPLICADCTKKRKAAERRVMLMAPIRFVVGIIIFAVCIFGVIFAVIMLMPSSGSRSGPSIRVDDGGGPSTNKSEGGKIQVKGYERTGSDGEKIQVKGYERNRPSSKKD